MSEYLSSVKAAEQEVKAARRQLNQAEKLIGKRLREEQSDWPMEITTPSEPKVREPRPAKVSRSGQAVPPRKSVVQPVRKAQAAPVRPAAHGSAQSGNRHNRRRSPAHGRPVMRTKR